MRPDNKGFSLIEIMVALAIMSILSIAIMKVYTGFTRSYTTQEVAAGVQQSLRGALNIMVQDIRMAGFDPADTDQFGIEEATATKIRITSDTNMNGVLEGSAANPQGFEQITYELGADNKLYQALYETLGVISRQPIVDNVTNLTFTYYDADGATPPVTAITSVEISMTIDEPAGRGGTVSRSLSTRVQCRNLAF